MEKGMKPSSRSVLNGFFLWHPVAPDLKTEGKAQTVMGDGVPQMQTGPMYLGVYVSEEQFVLLTEALLKAWGEKGIGAFRLSLKPFPPSLRDGL